MKTTETTHKTDYREENKLNLTLLIIAACFIFFGTAIIALAGPERGENPDGVSRPYKMIKSPEDFERSNPSMFISMEGAVRENILGNKFNVTAELKNIASRINYRNLVFEVVYYGIVGQELTREKIFINQEINAGSSKKVDFKIGKPKGCRKIEFIAVDATSF